MFGLLCLASPYHVCAQETEGPVVFTVSVERGNPCQGSNFVLIGELKNTSKTPVAIDKRGLRYYFIETSLDQSETSPGQSSLSPLLNLPRMRSRRSDYWAIDGLTGGNRGNFIRLEPGQSYYDRYIVDPATDDFYKTAGRYSITVGYGQFVKGKEKGARLFTGTVDATELFFEIRACDIDAENN